MWLLSCLSRRCVAPLMITGGTIAVIIASGAVFNVVLSCAVRVRWTNPRAAQMSP